MNEKESSEIRIKKTDLVDVVIIIFVIAGFLNMYGGYSFFQRSFVLERTTESGENLIQLPGYTSGGYVSESVYNFIGTGSIVFGFVLLSESLFLIIPSWLNPEYKQIKRIRKKSWKIGYWLGIILSIILLAGFPLLTIAGIINLVILSKAKKSFK